MLQQLLLAIPLAAITVLAHISGTVSIALPFSGAWRKPLPRAPWGPALVLTRLVSTLLVLHIGEAALWATAYQLAGVFPNFPDALYYSLSSYTTVGYSDVLPPPEWHLLGPIEAAVGVLMLGASTSVMVATAHRLYDIGAHPRT